MTIESPALPRPLQRMPRDFAKSTMSFTMRKYSGKPRSLDDRELVLQPPHRLGGDRPVALLEPVPCGFESTEYAVSPARHLGRREVERAETEVEVAALRDLERGVAGLRHAGEQAAHLAGGLEPQLGVRTVVRPRQRRTRPGRGEHVVQAELHALQRSARCWWPPPEARTAAARSTSAVM